MDSFETAIVAAVKTSINGEEFAESVVTLVREKKNASREEIIDVWNKIALEFTIKEKHKSKKKTKKTKKGEVKVDGPEDEVVEQQTCVYEMKKGPNAGNVCGKNVSDKSSTGNYCSKHLKEEHIEKRELGESELKGKRWDYFLNLNLDFDDNDDSDYEYEELEDIEDDSEYERNEDSDVLESEVEENDDDDYGAYEL